LKKFKPPLYRLSQRALIDFARAIGMGKIKLLVHKKGKEGAVRVTDPFHLAHCTAVILGGLDVIYGYPLAFTAREEDGSYIGELIPDKKDDIGDEETFIRLTTADLTPQKQAIEQEFPTCRRCGAPEELGQRFSFDMEEGVIKEKKSGERYIFYGHQSLNAILREFEKELGQDINDLFLRVEKERFSNGTSEPKRNELQ